jgi:DNA-binding NtrC family response regulator
MAADSYSGYLPPIRILVVDDNRDLLITISKALSRVDGYEVELQADPVVALRRISEAPFGLFLLDIRMPEIDGISLLAHCRRLHPKVPVILMTAYASVEQAVEIMRLGADYYLSKPFSPDSLRDVAARVLGERARARPPLPARGVFLTQDPATEAVLARAKAAADTDAAVLIQGESGTGKELLARFIHAHSRRSGGPFEVVNSAAMPESLVEAMLFGYEKGAFTGAVTPMPGRLEAASGGTLFMDEVGDMSLPVQSKVLRVLQDKTFQRLGDSKSRTVDVRYVFASNRNLGAMIGEKAFREDLYYRIGVVELTLPALRHRPGDLQVLIPGFLERFSAEAGREPPKVSGEAMEMLRRESWPGNVRQLENFCQRAVIFCPPGEWLTPDLARGLLGTQSPPTPGREAHTDGHATHLTRENVVRALASSNGNISKAASVLGISRPTLYAKLKKFQIDPQRVEPTPSPNDGA